MKIKYFKDTDPALFEFSDHLGSETKENSENIAVDMDADGNMVTMTIEHARRNTTLPDVVVHQIDKGAA